MSARTLTLVSEQEYLGTELESALHTSQGRLLVEDATLRIPGTDIEVPLQQLDQE